MANALVDRFDDVARLRQVSRDPHKLPIHRPPAAEIVSALHHCHARSGKALPYGKTAQRNFRDVRELLEQFAIGGGGRHGGIATRISCEAYSPKLGNEGCVRIDDVRLF